jgi:hypothetical protein
MNFPLTAQPISETVSYITIENTQGGGCPDLIPQYLPRMQRLTNWLRHSARDLFEIGYSQHRHLPFM